MKIGVISDTHGNLSAFDKALEAFSDCELIIHCGDILAPGPKNPIPEGYNPPGLAERINSLSMPLLIAKGNCDSEVDSVLLKPPIFPFVFLQDEKTRIIASHLPIDPLQFRADILITGHTHIPGIEERDGIIYLNPGSPSVPLSPTKIPTYAIIDDKITIYSLSKEVIIQWKTQYTCR
ncbi:MAG: phosphodiesterase [bacterium]